jgi:hypothetical protein
MRIWHVSFHRGQRGWTCRLVFTYATVRQFTDETETAAGAGRWWLTAYLCARREARRHVAIHGARPGERAAVGWSE